MTSLESAAQVMREAMREAADYWQRRQKLIGLAEYLSAKTKSTRPDESAAAHELAEALKLDRV